MRGLRQAFQRRKSSLKSATNFDLIGDYGSFFVAHGFDFGDRKAAVAQIGEGALQGLVQLILQGGSLLRRRENAGIDAILLAMTIIGKRTSWTCSEETGMPT